LIFKRHTIHVNRIVSQKQTNSPEYLRERVKQHFDNLADDYDTYKARSSYYYTQLKQLLKELMPDDSERCILEIGCGTGSLLASMLPNAGMGIDISEKMIAIARMRWNDYPELSFRVSDAETLVTEPVWNVVIMADVLEHLYNPEKAIDNISGFMTPGSTLLVTWANSYWEPILHFLEWLKLKMPEGEHNWAPAKSVIKMLKKYHFEIVAEGTRCLIPARLVFADTVNEKFYRIPGLKSLGLIRYIKAERSSS
jgi:2-polyprenyl-3-methyl-5-hydroxy-6-metoxy-1,4-benzoquinol methylase